LASAAAAFAEPTATSSVRSSATSGTITTTSITPSNSPSSDEDISRHVKRARSKDENYVAVRTKRRACGCWRRGPHQSSCSLYQGRRTVVSDPEFIDPLKRRDCGCKWRGTHLLTCSKSSKRMRSVDKNKGSGDEGGASDEDHEEDYQLRHPDSANI
jgi:hypothetical protein